MKTSFKKRLKSNLCVTFSLPIEFEVDAEDVEYEDKYGTSYVEEEYEIDVNQVIENDPRLKDIINNLKRQGFTIEELLIE